MIAPKPHSQPKIQRLPRSKPVTVCIAATHQDEGGPYIITACDRRISLFGGSFSEDTAIKFTSVHPQWIAMFAGGTEETRLMSEAISAAMEKLRRNRFESVINCCKKAYRKQYKRLIETEVLPDYDIDTYSEYLALRKTDEALFLTIREQIQKASDDWNLLFAGFDDSRFPHIFVIHGPGSIQYCDQQQRAAIGMGSTAALISLAFFSCPATGSIGYATFGVAAAKFFAERASDVGDKTILMILKPREQYAVIVPANTIDDMRRRWDELPKIPDGIGAELAQLIRNRFTSLETMQSVVQKAAQGR